MKKILLIAMMAFSTFSYAEERQKPVACYQLNEMLANLKTICIENLLLKSLYTEILRQDHGQ
jgi:hypothetical protein